MSYGPRRLPGTNGMRVRSYAMREGSNVALQALPRVELDPGGRYCSQVYDPMWGPRGDFIRHASSRGIPYLQLSEEEIRREIEDSRSF